jgi:hypothetical protein
MDCGKPQTPIKEGFTAKPARSKGGLDEAHGFISAREPFGYHPEMGGYPGLHNHLGGTRAPTRCIKGMNRIFTVSVLLACQAFAAGTVCSQQDTTGSAAPISLHLLKPDEPAPAGVRLSPFPPPLQAIFLVTNYTAETVLANLLAVEGKSGSNWITQMQLHGLLQLSATNATRMQGATNAFIPGLTTWELGPHQAAYSTVSFSGKPTASGSRVGEPLGCGMNYLAGQPTGTVWRLTVSVQDKLTGLADVSARLTRYSETRARIAAAPANPFSSAYRYFGQPTRVSSEEVPNQ